MRHTFHAHAIPALALVALAGCGHPGPLGRDHRDLGRQVPVERLRRVDPIDLSAFAKPPLSPEAQAAAVDLERRRFDGLDRAELSIEDARLSALANNLDLRARLVDPEIDAQRIAQEEARFEAAFTTRASLSENEPAVIDPFDPPRSRQAVLEPGVTIPLRTGGSASVSLPLTRTDGPGSGEPNPAYDADLRFSISHPLLRGAGRRVNAAGIELASLAQQATEARTKLAIINQLVAVERAYWRLYQARRDLDVRQQQYELADEQLRRAQRQLNAGRVPEIELVRAQAGLAQRLEAIITSQRAVLTQQRELKRLINRPDLPIDGKALVLTSTDPDPVEYDFDPDALTTLAEQGRMELLELELALLSDLVQIRVAENRTLPGLDAQARLDISGVGRGPGSALGQVRQGDFTSWSLGATLNVPLGNQDADARLREAVLTRMQRLVTRQSRRQVIRQDVLDAIDRVSSGWQSILATRQATVLSARSLAAEQRQFEVGASTSTQVLDAAARLAESQLAEIRALVDYQLAQVDLALATGTLLGAAKIRWEPITSTQTPADPAVLGPEQPDWPNPVRPDPVLRRIEPPLAPEQP